MHFAGQPRVMAVFHEPFATRVVLHRTQGRMIVFDPDFDCLQSGERAGGHENFDALQVIGEHLERPGAVIALRAAVEQGWLDVDLPSFEVDEHGVKTNGGGRRSNRLDRLIRRRPACGIFHDPQRFVLLEDGVRLMAGTEIKDASRAHLPGAAASEMLAAVPAFLEDDFIGCRDVKRLGIHFCVGHIPLPRQSGGHRVVRGQSGHVARGAVRPISRENAAGERESPHAVFPAQGRGQGRVRGGNFAIRVLVFIRKDGLGSLGGRNQGSGIVDSPLLHEANKWF